MTPLRILAVADVSALAVIGGAERVLWEQMRRLARRGHDVRVICVERIDRGEYRLKRKERRHNEGLVKLLLACPIKGWFKAMDCSETTDDIKVPRLA